MKCINIKEFNLIEEIRILWNQHATWTSIVVKSMILGLPDEEFVVNRLLQNPVDFQQALKPFYGDKLSAEFKDLLTEHLELAAEMIKAILAGDELGAMDKERKWYENADEISKFLDKINPYWHYECWKDMFYIHLGLIQLLISNDLHENYEASIDTQDEIEAEALEMADMMAVGIIKQFPRKFSR